jgi:transcriptional regulator
MYRPAAFAASDADAWALIAAAPLAQLVVASPDGLLATPVPLVRRGDTLVGHLARPNQLWRQPGDALAMFTGVDAYVSPRWYEGKPIDGRVVPTWNYTTVHVHGRLVVHDDAQWVGDVVRLLTDTFERPMGDPWSVDDAPADYLAAMLRGIVGIELVDLRIEAKAKLSQNRSVTDRTAVAEGLSAGSVTDSDVADAIRRTLPT